MNKVLLDGSLGADPELRFTQGGTGVLNFRMATEESVKKGDQWEKHVEWHKIVVWGKRGEGLAKILKKGSKVTIEGRIRKTEYTDKDNIKRFDFTIHADNVIPQARLAERSQAPSTQHHETHGAHYDNPATRSPSKQSAPANDSEQRYDSGDDVPF